MKQLLFNPTLGGKDTKKDCLNVRILSSTSYELRNGPCNVKDILFANCSNAQGHRTLVQVNGRQNFLIWVQEISETSLWNVEQAHTYIENFLQRETSGATVILYTRLDMEKEKDGHLTTVIISIMSLRAESAGSINLNIEDRLALEDQLPLSIHYYTESKTGYMKKNLAFAVVVVMLITISAMIAAISVTSRSSSDGEVWLKWNLPKDSKGPKHQLQFTWPHPNFTSWSANNDRTIDEFYLRLDDQTMIPRESVDEHELQYQAWYAKHYPRFAELGASQAYLNDSYWRDTRSYPLAIDHEFHVAHCILTMKRYWTARETGHHVCPRDLDHKHISHCFGVLETYAFRVSHGVPGSYTRGLVQQ